MADHNSLAISAITATTPPTSKDNLITTKFVNIDNVTPNDYDFVIVAAYDRATTEIVNAARNRGFDDEKIIELRTLRCTNFDWEQATTLSVLIQHLQPYHEKNSTSELFPKCFSYGKDVTVLKYNYDQKTVSKSENITIFSRNCMAGLLYHSLGLKFCSPLINMYMNIDDFFTFLCNPKYYMETPIKFDCWTTNPISGDMFPIFVCDNIKLYMNHYNDIDFAVQKWNERKRRINWDKVFILFSTEKYMLLRKFEKLQYKKICFVPFQYDSPHVINVDKSLYPNVPFDEICNGIAGGGIRGYWLNLVNKLKMTGYITHTA